MSHKPKTVLLIDGSNCYHSFKKEGELPFDYSGLFSRLSADYDLVEIRFYDALKDRTKEAKAYPEQQAFHASLTNLSWPLVLRTRKLQYHHKLHSQTIEQSGKKVGILPKCRAKLQAFLECMGLDKGAKEKGIDVMLAIDAVEIAMGKQAGTIIIFSGDADFTPAVSTAQKLGVRVVNLHTYSGSSKELRDSCNAHITMSFNSTGYVLKKREILSDGSASYEFL